MDLFEISGGGIAKQLAACKQSSRNSAVRLLCSWLSNQNDDPSAAGVVDPELIKIWKGLFFCMWHSDKAPAQLELINRLAFILSSLPPPLAGNYLEAFLITIRREWSGIDFFRLNKFYLLIRKFLRHVFILIKNNSWNLDLTDRIIGILLKGSLLSTDKFSAAGVNYHISEIFLDELSDFLPLAKETLDLMLSSFISVMQTTTDKILVKKIKVNIFDRLAAKGSDLLKGADAGIDVEKFGKIALAMGFSKKFFDSAAADETRQTNRRVLFGLHRRYLKLYKELEKLGLDISLENLNNGVLVRESALDMEAGNAITTGSCNDFIEETGDDQKKKKKRRRRRMLKKDERHFDVTEVISKTKKKKRKCLGSSTENNAIDCIKMTKSKKKKLADSPVEDNGAEEALRDPRAVINNENGKSFSCSNDMISFDDTLKSILQKHIEKLASESGITAKLSKKRKHSKSTGKQKVSENSEDLDGGCGAGKSAEKAKKVSFSLNSNLIWKPQNPMPPQSLRLPPSATPRGSALKRGLSPGPIRESPPTVKRIMVKGSSVKARRIMLRKSVSL
ncbi:hypothetical protein KSP39_PZI021098 [Platanthera zijinensis]|uniref:Ribosomal RNA processing protein 1 homolog n=1 Tax=Platanthera zijinensis TaxID=2320716 RepID=A0AAP0AWY9_9ASPA